MKITNNILTEILSRYDKNTNIVFIPVWDIQNPNEYIIKRGGNYYIEYGEEYHRLNDIAFASTESEPFKGMENIIFDGDTQNKCITFATYFIKDTRYIKDTLHILFYPFFWHL